MTVLIADDQDVVRQGLIKMMTETGVELHVVLEASDGEEALQLYEEHHPDLILVDIMMPRLDGISLIEKLKASGCTSHFVIISAYSDFDYAKRAISCKVDGYLLKPVSKLDLYKVLMEIQIKISDDSLVSTRMKDSEFKYYFRLLYDYLASRDALVNPSEIFSSLGTKFDRGSFMIAICGAFDNQNERLEKEKEAACAEFLLLKIPHLVFVKEKNRLVIIGNMEPDQASQFEKVIIRHAGASGKSLFFGMSGCANGMQALRECFDQAYSAYKEALAGGINFCKGSDLKHGAKTVITVGEYAKLLELINRVDKKGLDSLLDVLFFRMSGRMLGLNETVSTFIGLIDYLGSNLELLYPGLGDRKSVQERLSEAATVFQVKSIVKEAIDSIYAHVADANHKDHASYIVNFLIGEVRKKFPEKVSLAELALELDMNYNYVSGLFAKKMGTTFSEYSLGYRLEKAREMLKTGKWKINEVSDKCGFYDSKYFSKAFKKVFGLTPGEFKNGM